MTDPPDPALPPGLLDAIAKLLFRLIDRDATRELGELATPDGATMHLVATSGGTPGSIQWALVERVPAGVAAYRLSRTTYDILLRASAAAEGGVVANGTRFHLRAIWDGTRHVADAVQVA
ncbi:hypothetical protein [Polyangium sp. 15x6]|uniref:hypothetical protein n=1 Tax=Polyangium sp. 15x6 TaxID=3042687 RepID=UPI00249A2DF9|nr:hypothetical protein [Polyangium sp. 15x6]MDI3284886.1 hypothetical protein [Polyangium sp. 15x6]